MSLRIFFLSTLYVILLAPIAAAEPAAPLKPFTATYEAKFRGFGVTATRELSGGNGNWRLDFDVHSMFASIEEYSRFLDDQSQLRPQRYELHKSGLGRKQRLALNFENDAKSSDARRVVNLSDARRNIDNAPSDIQDKLSYQLQLALDLAAGKQPLQYQVADGRKIREYEFEVIGNEQLQTPLGAVDTIKVRRLRDGDAERATTIWFAPGWNYALVKLVQHEDDGKNYQIELTKLSIEGNDVTTHR